jgi:hypothetical protein
VGKRQRTGGVQRLAISAGVFLALLLLPAPGLTATRTVTTLADVTNPNDGVLSRREAIAASGAGDTIEFAVTGIRVLTGELTINRDLSIRGPGQPGEKAVPRKKCSTV